MDKIKKVVNSPLFIAAVAGGVGFLLMLQGNTMYSGIGYGIGVVKFIDALKA